MVTIQGARNKESLFWVDGPEFDGHQVDWDLMLSRQNIYVQEEQHSLNRYLKQRGQP